MIVNLKTSLMLISISENSIDIRSSKPSLDSTICTKKNTEEQTSKGRRLKNSTSMQSNKLTYLKRLVAKYRQEILNDQQTSTQICGSKM